MVIEYKNKYTQRICNDEKEMDAFFDHNKALVEGLKVLMTIFNHEQNISCFHEERYKGYEFEPVEGEKNKYSIRIIPKKRKSSYRLYLEPTNHGIEIKIIKIDKHKYRFD